jgi:hypothetical protein
MGTHRRNNNVVKLEHWMVHIWFKSEKPECRHNGAWLHRLKACRCNGRLSGNHLYLLGSSSLTERCYHVCHTFIIIMFAFVIMRHQLLFSSSSIFRRIVTHYNGIRGFPTHKFCRVQFRVPVSYNKFWPSVCP